MCSLCWQSTYLPTYQRPIFCRSQLCHLQEWKLSLRLLDFATVEHLPGLSLGQYTLTLLQFYFFIPSPFTCSTLCPLIAYGLINSDSYGSPPAITSKIFSMPYSSHPILSQAWLTLSTMALQPAVTTVNEQTQWSMVRWLRRVLSGVKPFTWVSFLLEPSSVSDCRSCSFSSL